MSIVSPTDFIGDVNIPNNEDTYNGVKANVQFFIDKYEPIFLESLLGYTLYQEYLAGIVPVPVEPATDPVTYVPINPKWIAIQTLTKPLILNFVYYYFKEDEFGYSSGIGVIRAKGENSTPVSPARKMVSRWNEMVKGVYKVIARWDVEAYGDYYLKNVFYNLSTWGFEAFYDWLYPRYCQKIPDIFFTTNTYQI